MLRDVTEDKELYDKRSYGDPGKVIVYHMPMRDWQQEDIKMLRAKGHKIIADVDDLLKDVAGLPDHPAAGYFTERLPLHEQLLSEADAITASTPFLAEKMLQYNDNVYLCENGVDPWRFHGQRMKDHGSFVIGWSGGVGHADSWQMIGPQVADFMRAYSDAVLMVLGEPPPEGCGLDDPEFTARCINQQWSKDMLSYVPWMLRFTVGLSPSMATDFYRAKSPIRLHELQAAKVPALCSETTYGDHFEDRKTAFLVADDEWFDALDRLHYQRRMARGVGMNGYRHFMQNSTINHMLPQWHAAISSLL